MRTLLENPKNIELPFQEQWHFVKFALKHRHAESKEEIKAALDALEKDALLLNLIPIAFDDDLEANEQVTKMLIDFKTALNIIWDFIIISFRFYGEPEGLYSCYTSEFKRLDKFFVENSTLPLADSEAIIDIFKHCVNINENLRGQRNIEITTTDANVHRSDTDVVMQETVLPSVTGQIGSSSLTDLPVTLAENQMDTWKPGASTIMQQFQDYDNEGFDMSKCLFDIVQNSKLRFIACQEVFLFGLKFTDLNSASEWALRSVENYITLGLPETFEDLQKVPLDRPYNFLMSMDTNSINKEIARLGVEALMFWELPKVDNALTLTGTDFAGSRGPHLCLLGKFRYLLVYKRWGKAEYCPEIRKMQAFRSKIEN